MPTPQSNKKWLIIRNGAVGDTLLLSPVAQAIRGHIPDAHIEVMGNVERTELLVGDGLADKATAFDQPGMEALFCEEAELPPQIKTYFNAFDVIIYYGQSGLDGIASKLKTRDEQVILTHPALPKEDIHITKHYLQAISSLLNVDKPYLPKLTLSEDEIAWGKAWLQERMPRFEDHFVLGLHVGAGSITKMTPFELFHQKIKEIQPQNPLILIPKGPADEEAVSAFAKTLMDDTPHVIVDGLQLRKLAAVLSHCKEFTGNDSGVTHIAAALQIPTTAIFVTGNPEIWKPLGKHVSIICVESSNSN